MSCSEWKAVKLGELCTLNYGKSLPAKKRKHGNIPVYSSAGITGYHNSPLVEREGIIIGRKGSVGTVYYSPTPFFCIDTAYYVLPSEDYNLKYLYYRLKSLGLENLNEDSAVPGLNRETAYTQHFLLPPHNEQKAIADTLSCLDDKIELNNRINKKLEEMAQAIFKSWFVDFEPFQDGEFEDSELGRIPKEWRVVKVEDIDIKISDYVANGSFASLKQNVKLYEEEEYAYFIRNVDLKSKVFRKYVDEHSYNFLSNTKLFGNEVIISNVGDVGSVHLCPALSKPMTLGNNMIMIKSENSVYYNYFMYILFKHSYGKDLIQSITGGSAQPKFNKTDFRNLKIIMPTDDYLYQYNKIVGKLLQKRDHNNQEIKILSAIRDTLLPKLMSGEMRVPIEEAGNQ